MQRQTWAGMETVALEEEEEECRDKPGQGWRRWGCSSSTRRRRERRWRWGTAETNLHRDGDEKLGLC